MSLTDLLRVVCHRGWLIAVCTLIAAAGAYAVTSHEHKRYTASSSVTFELNPLNGQIAGIAAASPASIAAQQVANVELLRGSSVAVSTAAHLKDGLSAQQVAQAVTITGGGESNTVVISASAHAPGLAAAIANAYAAEFVREQRTANRAYFASTLKVVRGQLAHLSRSQSKGGAAVALEDRAQTLALLSALNYGSVQVAQNAIAPTGPSAPKTSRDTLLGAFLGLLLGLVLVLSLERMSPTLTTPEQLERCYGARLIGTVPALSALSARLGASQPMSPEARRTMGLLRARLALIGGQRTPATLLIAGAGRSEGTSTVARGLAEAYARHGTQTLLVECDVASPRQAGRLGLDDGPGLAELLAGAATSAQVTSHVALEGGSKLAVICAGHCGQEGAQLLDSSAMRSLLEQLAERYELVLLDAPAFDATPEALALVEHADGVVVVGRLGGGRVQASREFAQLLASSQAHVLGVIANAVKRRRPIALDAPGEWASHAATGKLTADTATPVPVTPGEA